MEIKYNNISGGKGSPKATRDHNISRQFKARSCYSQRSNLFAAIAKANGGDVVSRREEDGVVKMKIIVRKQDLKQMLQIMSFSSNSNSNPNSSLSLEQRLNFLRKKQLLRANMARHTRRSSWRPVLQSIPE